MWFMFLVRRRFEKIAEARSKGVDVWGETCPQYLVLDQTYLERPDFEGAKYVWSPPLREKWNQEVLWNALKNGQLQTLGSDQCSFDFKGQKDLGRDDFTKIPNGGPIIEDRVIILFSEGVKKGRISLESVCRSYFHTSGQIIWFVSEKRNDCRWCGC